MWPKHTRFKIVCQSTLILAVTMIQNCLFVSFEYLGFLSPSALFIHSKWPVVKYDLLRHVWLLMICSFDIKKSSNVFAGAQNWLKKVTPAIVSFTWTVHFKCLWLSCFGFVNFCSKSLRWQSAKCFGNCRSTKKIPGYLPGNKQSWVVSLEHQQARQKNNITLINEQPKISY